MSDEKLRAVYNARVQADAPADRAGCPSPEQLQALAEGAKNGAPDLAALDHVFGCAHCKKEFAILRAVQSASNEEDKPSAATQKADARWFSAPRIAAAAVLLLVIGIGGQSLFRQSDSATVDTLRDGSADASDVATVSPTANETVTDNAPFVWRKVAGAVSYELQLLDTTGAVLTTQITSDTAFTLSAEDRAKVMAAKSFDWFVAAKRSDGNERRSQIVRARAN